MLFVPAAATRHLFRTHPYHSHHPRISRRQERLSPEEWASAALPALPWRGREGGLVLGLSLCRSRQQRFLAHRQPQRAQPRPPLGRRQACGGDGGVHVWSQHSLPAWRLHRHLSPESFALGGRDVDSPPGDTPNAFSHCGHRPQQPRAALLSIRTVPTNRYFARTAHFPVCSICGSFFGVHLTLIHSCQI